MALAEDLALALRVENVAVSRESQGIVLTFGSPDARPVTFRELWAKCQGAPACTALLGMTAQGAPLLARLSAPEVAHVLVAGTTGSGKTVLLRTMATSLAVGNRATAVRLVVMDPKGRSFPGMESVPHLARPVLVSADDAMEALGSLVRLMEIRDRDGEQGPRVIVIIDELADLIMQGETRALQGITRLVQRGREAGIHVVAATQYPSAAILSGLMRANFPLRLVGKVVSADDARVASGRGGTDAHLLMGRGDFVAVRGGTVTRFQVAYLGDQEAATLLASLRGQAEEILPEPSDRIVVGPDWMRDGVQTLLANWSWWVKRQGEWGSKKELHELLFPDKPYGGVFVERAQAIADEAERQMAERATTTTTHAPRSAGLRSVGATS
jgi:S-DNA-T family DNA segregation ATPase FtsK/SpoIIIE